MHIITEKSAITPLSEDIEAKYDPDKEPTREQNIGKEKAFRKYKNMQKAAI